MFQCLFWSWNQSYPHNTGNYDSTIQRDVQSTLSTLFLFVWIFWIYRRFKSVILTYTGYRNTKSPQKLVGGWSWFFQTGGFCCGPSQSQHFFCRIAKVLSARAWVFAEASHEDRRGFSRDVRLETVRLAGTTSDALGIHGLEMRMV